MTESRIVILGIFVADLAFATPRLPALGETVLGAGFRTGPGGKGSNQAVAAARLNGRVGFISRLGRDGFAEMAHRLYRDAGIDTSHVYESAGDSTGAAAILVNPAGENAIIVVPGAGAALSIADVERAEPMIARASVFLTQLEQPLEIAEHGLRLARRHGLRTILNPAPSQPLTDALLALVDVLTPNETEAEALAGLQVRSLEDAAAAAALLRGRGAGAVVITLGARGALVCTAQETVHVPAVEAGPVVDTTGAGDAFAGGLAVALDEGRDLVAATRFGCAVAGLAVTRPGTAPAMPRREEVDALLAGLVARPADSATIRHGS
ncbi:MAG: ribokinase [Acetobacteraceae bacterium]